MKNVFQGFFGRNKVSSSQGQRFANPTYAQFISLPSGGWEPVGFDENGYYVILSRKTGKLVTLRPRQLDGDTLRGVVGSEYCERDSKTEKEIFSPESLADEIRTECDRRGAFDLSSVRYPGFYADDGALTVHFGNEVFPYEGLPAQTTPKKPVYVTGKSLGFTIRLPRLNRWSSWRMP